MGLLSVAIWLPILSGGVLLALGRDEHAVAVRWLALVASIASFLVTIPLITNFDLASGAMQFQEKMPWTFESFLRHGWKGENADLTAQKASLPVPAASR